MTNSSPDILKSLLEYESRTKILSIDSNSTLEVYIFEDTLNINYKNQKYYGKINRQLIHQLGSKIWGTNKSFEEIFSYWEKALYNEEKLISLIIKVLIDPNTIIKYIPFEKGNLIYGIISPYFKEINQLELRSKFIEYLNLSNIVYTGSQISINKYGQIFEVFNFPSPGKLSNFSYVIQYGRNNGYSANTIYWERRIVSCSNQLTTLKNSENLKLIHLKKFDLDTFIFKILDYGIKKHYELEEKIQHSQLTALDKEAYNEFINRIYIASVSKPRIKNRLHKEIADYGKTEFALSQACTWLGTHDRHIGNRTKKTLRIAGTKILEETLPNYLENTSNEYFIGEQKYGSLLPVGFNSSY